ncbi:MAG: chloride channel protein, partial [Gemmatimonadales bacterium]
IAGVFFSLEKVMGTLRVSSFPPVLVASVIAAALTRSAFGDSPVIEIPTEYTVGAGVELVFYALLGVLTGLVAVAYSRGTYAIGDMLRRFRSPWWQVIVGALIIGTLNVVFRADLWGKGHETLTLEIIGDRTGLFLIGLAFAKLLVTAVTVAAVRAGGVFTPALFIGATLAGGLAVLATGAIPGFHIEPEAFALVGMAGLVAGSTHAPLTAIMVVFEMTSDYALILPLMLCGAIAFITARRISVDSIYSQWLTRKGEKITFGQDINVMERLRVDGYYNRDPNVVSESATVEQIMAAIGSSRQTEFPVIDPNLHFVGMLTYDDLRAVVSQADTLAPIVVASDLASKAGETVTPRDTLRTALQRLAVRGGHYVPVVDPADSERLLGLLSRQDILGAYERELLREEELEEAG